MSLTASSLLARLEELKKWQEKQQERLTQQQLSRGETSGASSNYNTIDGLSEFNSSVDITKNNSKESFEGILVEKDTNVNGNEETGSCLTTFGFQKDFSDDTPFRSPTLRNETAPVKQTFSDNPYPKSAKFTDPMAPVKKKKPFLKRGSGLIKYKMNPGDQNRPFNKSIKRKSNLKNNKTIKDYSSNADLGNVDYEITPLKKPDMNIKAVWFKVQNDDDEYQKKTKDDDMYNANVFTKKNILSINELAAQEINTPLNKQSPLNEKLVTYSPVQEVTLDEINPIKNKTTQNEKQLGPDVIDNIVTEETLVKNTILQINEIIAQKIDMPINRQLLLSYENNNDSESKIHPPILQNMPKISHTERQVNEQSLYEKQLEKELLIFEALEEKAMNSSFCSTNSSILRILSSTPSKIKNRNIESKLRHEGIEKQHCIEDYILEGYEDHVLIDKQYEPNKINLHKNISNGNSLNSSVTSEDFETKSGDRHDFKDDIPWSDDNILTRENSNLSSASVTTTASSQKEDTLVSDVVETNKSIKNEGAKELLAKKLKELDKEIQNFRTENAKLQKEKFELEKQKREFKKEKKAFEKYVLEEKINVEFYLEDEKKKLAKEKMVFERYVKDAQNKTTRKEREEISSLKEEIANLKEASKLKETRNATSQARLRNQIKSFEKDISNLKDELEKLRKQNAKLSVSQKLNKKSSETKMLHEINKNLSKLTQDVKVTEQLKKMEESIEKKELLSDSLKNDDITNKYLENDEDSDFFYGKGKSDSKSIAGCCQMEKKSDLHTSYEDFLKDKKRKNYKEITNEPERISLSKKEMCSATDEKYLKNPTNVSLERSYERIFDNNVTKDTHNNEIMENSKLINEVTLTDGMKMISYPNGNVKTISADGNSITIKYFNGDIKETKLLEGIIRYFYAENESWQTTMADGMEIIEFSSGQTETKFKDGTIEIKFPNGIVRLIKPDGSESISYSDNTKVDIDFKGQKTIYIPNGQKEVHTAEHMRREYPDGTVKIVYPDGIQETRYSNGRIRVKDKDGRLLMDTYDDNT